MKHVLGLVTVVLSLNCGSAFAQSPAFAWLKSQLPANAGAKEFLGHTPMGRQCGLYLTDKSYDTSADYFVVVGYVKGQMSDYIGVVASKSETAVGASEIRFSADESWGNDSKSNRLRIILDAQGNPVRAMGASDLKEIDCKLN